MADKKKKDEDEKGLLDKLEEVIFPHERKREAAEEQAKADAERARAEASRKAEEQRRQTAAQKAEQARKAEEQRRETAQQDERAGRAERARQAAEERRRQQEAKATSSQQDQPGGEAKAARTHTVKSGETLSHLALKYYGSASQENWMRIYEANKATIGDNPNMIRVGQELVIP